MPPVASLSAWTTSKDGSSSSMRTRYSGLPMLGQIALLCACSEALGLEDLAYDRGPDSGQAGFGGTTPDGDAKSRDVSGGDVLGGGGTGAGGSGAALGSGGTLGA